MRTSEAGQVAPLAAVAIGLVLALAMALSLIGSAIIERQQATIAADAAALARASNPPLVDDVSEWYRQRGVELVTEADGHARAANDVSRALSRAALPNAVTTSPAMVAVVERARQLLGDPLLSADIDGVAVSFDGSDAARFTAVADDLVVCEIGGSGGRRMWELCR